MYIAFESGWRVRPKRQPIPRAKATRKNHPLCLATLARCEEEERADALNSPMTMHNIHFAPHLTILYTWIKAERTINATLE